MTSLWQHVPVDAQFSGLILWKAFFSPSLGVICISGSFSQSHKKWEPPFINLGWDWGRGSAGDSFSAAGGGLPE